MFRFSHVGIVVQNMDESVDFYTRVLGCKIHRRQSDENVQFTLLKAGNQEIELLRFADDLKERKEGIISHIAFSVEDIAKEINRLRDLGLHLSTDQPREVMGGMKIFFFTGPSGETIEFVQSNRHSRRSEKVLIMTSVPMEQEAVLRGIKGDPRFDVLVAGVGPAAAAINTAKALVSAGYGLVVSAGIGGGFPGQAEVGSLVVADEIVAADLGAETPEGFTGLDKLGFGPNRIKADTGMVKQVSGALLAAGLPVTTGPVLTVSTVTGTSASAVELAARVPGAAAEAMEGYGVALAAQDRGVPILEVRVISNRVGPRERTAWRIKEALQVLETAGSVLLEVLS